MKSKIREEMKMKRKAMPKEEVLVKSLIAQNNFLKSKIYQNCKVLMLYMPLGNEVLTQKMIENAFADGKTVLVPVTDGETFEISAHKIEQDTKFEVGVFSLKEPKFKELFDKDKIDVVLVPGVAFSRRGTRIGFGKGCYDRFLKECKATKVGFCYEFQLTEKIISDSFDIDMNYIVTEKEIIDCKAELSI